MSKKKASEEIKLVVIGTRHVSRAKEMDDDSSKVYFAEEPATVFQNEIIAPSFEEALKQAADMAEGISLMAQDSDCDVQVSGELLVIYDAKTKEDITGLVLNAFK